MRSRSLAEAQVIPGVIHAADVGQGDADMIAPSFVSWSGTLADRRGRFLLDVLGAVARIESNAEPSNVLRQLRLNRFDGCAE